MSQSTTVPPVSNPGQTKDPGLTAIRPRRRRDGGGHGEDSGAPAPVWVKVVITLL